MLHERESLTMSNIYPLDMFIYRIHKFLEKTIGIHFTVDESKCSKKEEPIYCIKKLMNVEEAMKEGFDWFKWKMFSLLMVYPLGVWVLYECV